MLSIPTSPIHSHSADVRLKLVIGDRTLDVAKIGPSQVCLQQPIDLDPCEGELIMSVDGRLRRWIVRLPEGAVSSDCSVVIEDVHVPIISA